MSESGHQPAEGRLFGLLTRIENTAMAVFLLAALVVGTAQVVLRYVFNMGFVWTEGAVIVLTIWGCLFGASRAVSLGLHVRVEVFADSLPPGGRRALALLAHLISAVYVGVLFYAGILYVRFLVSIGAISINLQIPEWLIYLIVPISMGLFLIHYLREFWLARHDGGPRPHPVVYD